jgi:trk system potassium uptake protein TrkA
LGSELATRIFEQGNEVSIIDNVPAAFNNLPANFQGRIIEGEALSEDVLHRAGIERADALAAVTNLDALNAVAAHIARVVYDVPVVVVRNYDPYCRPLHEAFDLQVVSSSSWGAQRMEELLYHGEIRTLFSAGNGEVEVYEITVPKSWQERPLSDLIETGQSMAIALTRAGKAVLPEGNMTLHAGDVVTISATLEGIEAIRRKVNGQ